MYIFCRDLSCCAYRVVFGVVLAGKPGPELSALSAARRIATFFRSRPSVLSLVRNSRPS